MPALTSFPQTNPIRVLAADNSSMNTQLLVEALARNGQFVMAGSGSTPAEILASVRREHTHVALISARQGNDAGAGFELCRDICAGSPTTRVILLLDSSERKQVIEAFRAGARGVFSRTESLKLLAKSILCVHGGQVWASSAEVHYILEALARPVSTRFEEGGAKSILSARELDVVRCVAEGLSNREIAHRLTLREHTVKNYLFRIFDKLGVSSRVEVVLYALGTNGAAPKTGPEVLSKPVPGPKNLPALAPVIARPASLISIART